MTADVLWPSFSPEDGTRIRKWLYGNALVRDWNADGSTDMEDVIVFGTGGDLNPDLLKPIADGGFGFFDCGNITENGVSFDPQFSADETMIWQSRKAQRTDITKDEEQVQFAMADSTPLQDYLYNNLPIGTAGVGTQLFPSLGSDNYSVSTPTYSDIVFRQLLIIGVDGSVGAGGQSEYIVELRPRVSLYKKNKRQWAAKQVDVTDLTWSVYVDPASGYDRKTIRGGTVWLDEGGPVVLPSPSTVTATATTAAHATVVFNEPTSPNQPFTYTVTQQTGGTGPFNASTVDTTATNSGVVTITVSGLVASSTYVFKVVATAANNTTATYPNSNSITAS